MSKKSEVGQFKADLDIYKANGEYDKSKIKNINENKINFVYECAINLIKDIKDDLKTVGTRSAWLFGYLAAILATLAPFALEDLSAGENTIKWAIIIIYVVCLSIIILFANRLVGIKLGDRSYNEPKKLLTKTMFENDMKLIKIFATERLQEIIKKDEERLKTLTSDFNFCLSCIILSVPLALGFILVTYFI